MAHAFMKIDTEYFGGANLIDSHIGSVSFRDASGGDIKINVSNDPEYTMSGLYEPDSAFDKW